MDRTLRSAALALLLTPAAVVAQAVVAQAVVAQAGVAQAGRGAGGQEAVAARAAPTLALDGVAVVDVAAGTVTPGRRVVVRGDTILAVEDASAPGDRAELTLDARGLFLIPGLVDHHVHLGPGSEDALARALRGGVTLVQAMAGDVRPTADLARRVDSGEIDGPEVAYASVMAGPAFHEDPRFRGAARGYDAGQAPWMLGVTDETDVVRAVAAARGAGAEVLKLYAMIDADLLARLVDEARRQGLRTVAHATVFPARPDEVVAAGVDVLTHAPYLSWQGAAAIDADDAWARRDGPYGALRPDGPEMQAVYEAMARRGTYLEPTLHVFGRGEAPDPVLTGWAAAATLAAHRAGVPLLAGTDGMIGGGPDALPNIHEELAALVAAGLTPAEALAAATVTPARAMGRTRRGRVAPGYAADLVLLGGDPLADIAHTRDVRWVVRRGRLVEAGR